MHLQLWSENLMHCLSKSNSKIQSHQLICFWCINHENRHSAGTEAAGTGEKLQPMHSLLMLKVCPLQQSPSDSPRIMSPSALKETFDIWPAPSSSSDILGPLTFSLFSAISVARSDNREVAVQCRGGGGQFLQTACLAPFSQCLCFSDTALCSPRIGWPGWLPALTWQLLSHPPPVCGLHLPWAWESLSLECQASQPAGRILFALAERLGFYKTYNGGISWRGSH